MFITYLVARRFVLIIAAPSYAVNVFIAKPMAVTTTSFFIHLALLSFWLYLILSKYHHWLFRLHND